MMNKKPQLPLYLWVEERLRRDISLGIFKEGELIPTERELAQKYGVSPGTVRRAALTLKEKGLLYRVQGKGTSVVFQDYNRHRFRHFRFMDHIHSDLLVFNLSVIGLKVIPAKEDISEYLGIRKGSKVLCLERMGNITEKAFLHTVSYLPKGLYKGLENYTTDQFIKNTLWKIQEVFFGISIKKREEFFSFVPADREMARLFGVESGNPIFSIETILTASSGDLVEYRRSLCNLGTLKFYGCREFF